MNEIPVDPLESDNPTDTTLVSVVDAIDHRDGDGQFGAMEGGDIRCFTCRRVFGADRVDADRVTRLEGASDPADMVMVLPVQCPFCHAAGSLVLHYGPAASAEESDVMARLSRSPHSLQGTNAAPGVDGV